MANPVKLHKLSDDSDAFVEIGEKHVRIGVGDKVSIILDEETINAAASGVNFQMDPQKMTYQGILTNTSGVAGLYPVGPSYLVDVSKLQAFSAIFKAVKAIRGGTGF